MAKNWLVSEAVEAIRNGDAEAIQDIGKRFPMFAVLAGGGEESLVKLLKAVPELITARKVEKQLEDMLTENNDDEDSEEVEEKAEKPAKGKTKKGKAKKEVEEAEDAEDEEEEEAEESENSDFHEWKLRELKDEFKRRKWKLPKVVTKKILADMLAEAGAEEVEEEDEEEEEKPKKSKKTKGKKDKKKPKKEEKAKDNDDDEEEEDDEEDDDDWDI